MIVTSKDDNSEDGIINGFTEGNQIIPETITNLTQDYDSMTYDADDCDIVVQIACFGRVVYA